MKQYAGLDVSLKEVSIRVVDGDSAVLARGVVPTKSDAISAFFVEKQGVPERILHESGQLSIWLQRELGKLGLPVICIDARIAHKALSARLNKSDRADAEGLAQLARIGWFTPLVHPGAPAQRGGLPAAQGSGRPCPRGAEDLRDPAGHCFPGPEPRQLPRTAGGSRRA